MPDYVRKNPDNQGSYFEDSLKLVIANNIKGDEIVAAELAHRDMIIDEMLLKIGAMFDKAASNDGVSNRELDDLLEVFIKYAH